MFQLNKNKNQRFRYVDESQTQPIEVKNVRNDSRQKPFKVAKFLPPKVENTNIYNIYIHTDFYIEVRDIYNVCKITNLTRRSRLKSCQKAENQLKKHQQISPLNNLVFIDF